MADSQERAALVALLRRYPKIWKKITHAVEWYGSAQVILEGKASLYPDVDLEEASIQIPLQGFESLGEIANEIKGWEDSGLRFTTVLDDDYPPQLRSIFNHPPFVFLRGSFLPEDANSVAVVGTRKPTPDGRRRAAQLSKKLAQNQITVVSGLAAGIDTAAHEAALESGGRTVAVIGTGILRCYPKENASLQDRIAREGVIVSQFWPDSPPARFHFPMRNAVMSGLVLATVVVEASAKSGAKMQARLALEHGRWVFLLKSLVDTAEWAKEYATKPGTTVVGRVDDIVDKLKTLLERHDVLIA